MATAHKYRLKQIPTDVWSIREKLCLASSVLRSGDQNWVSVSRAIKPYGEANRPPDWFSQKNCAIQYSDLLEKVETPKRKRGDRADVETPGNLIVRKLTIERIEELKRLINEEQQRHRKLRGEVDQVRSGCFDERLDEVWNRIQEEVKLKVAAEVAHNKWLQEREARIAALKNAPKTLGKTKRLYPKQTRLEEVRRNSSQSEQSEQESALDSPLSEPLSIEYFAQVEDVSSPQPPASHTDNIPSTTKATFPNVPVSTPAPNHGSQTSTSPLLTSLLKSPAPTTAISPTAGSLLTSPTPQPKEGTLPTTQASPRASTTPQPFFDPSCALATAAARQFAVATAPSPTPSSVESMFVRDRSQLGSQIESMDGHIHPLQAVQSATSSAPTLSKLLELPPGVPGKLPPLPVIKPEGTSSTVQTSTASTVTITTAASVSALVGTNVVSVITPETTIVNPTDDFPPADSLISTTVAEDTEQMLNNAFVSHCDGDIKVKVEPPSPIAEAVEEETEVEIKPEITVKMEETGIATGSFPEGSLEYKNKIFCTKEEKEHEEEEAPVTKTELPEVVAEEEAKESCADVLSESEKTEAETTMEPQEVTTETEGSPLETDSETMAETNTEELAPSKEDVVEGVEEDGKGLSGELQLPSVIEEQSEESRNEETVSDEQTSENLVVTEDENIPTTEDKKDTWEKTEVVEKEDLPTSPESVKPQEEEIKASRKISTKRGRKPKIRPGKVQNAEESDESTRDKKDDDNSNASSLVDKDITVKQSDSSKHERVKETPPATPKSELPQSECSEQSLVETKRKPTLSVSESVPNSPASTSQSDDQDTAKDYRTWKKAIMLVWNAAANHKFANTFLHPVTDDVAPGYHSIVYRPMDLSAIKKNIETGVIKTTIEFQRDMMLMFQNAVMYNSSDHDVFHMAVEMQKEVMEHIQDFLATQLMVQTADTKVLRGREREREKKSEGDKDDLKRKHPFTTDSETKSKKRRIRD